LLHAHPRHEESAEEEEDSVLCSIHLMDSNNGTFKVGTLLTAVEFITAISTIPVPITTLGGRNTAPVATHPLRAGASYG